MSDAYENGRLELEKLVEYYQSRNQHRNEATTRFHLIDRLLTKCLGWDHDDITAEDSYNGEYSDYTLRLVRPIAVLEAKKQGNYFELPIGTKNRIVSIKSLIKDNKNLSPIFDQVAGYCQKRGIPIAMFSNGWQVIAFVGNRNDSVAPLEGMALVFESLDQMLNNFLEVWNNSLLCPIWSKKLLRVA